MTHPAMKAVRVDEWDSHMQQLHNGKPRRLTNRQKLLYRAVLAYQKQHAGNTPNLRHLMEVAGYKSTGATLAAVNAIAERGLWKVVSDHYEPLQIIVRGAKWSVGK